MTISTTTRKAGPYAGNDVSTAFAFTFKVFSDEDLRVVQTDADGVETELTLGAEFTATINADQSSDPGGLVTLDTALPTGELLTLTSAMDATQPVQLENGGAFYPEVLTDALDRVTILIQQLEERAARTLRAPVSDVFTGVFEMPSASLRAGKALVFDAEGAPDAASYTIINVVEESYVATPGAGSVTPASFAASVHLASIAGLTGAADKLIYLTDADSAALTDFGAFGRSLVGAADAAAALTVLGLSAVDGSLYLPIAGGVTATGAVVLGYTNGGELPTETGFRGVPINTQSGAYAFVKDDMGRCVRHDHGSAHAWTIAPYATSDIPIGAAITVRNGGAGIVTLTRGAGVALRISGSATDANVALAANGMATLLHEALNTWVVAGSGLS